MAGRRPLQLSNYEASPVADEIEGWGPGFEELFLRKYWQKKPLMIRKAIPNVVQYLDSCLTKEDMFSLSYDDDVESRLIQRKGQKWNKDYGPLDESMTDDLSGSSRPSTIVFRILMLKCLSSPTNR
jgi:hypothetical protein